MNRRWRVGVAGCGGAAYGIHLPILAAHDAFELNAVHDRNPCRARRAAQDFDFTGVADTTDELLEGIDLLLVLTPHHEELIEAGLDGGINVFTEKPISLDMSRAAELVERARKRDLLLEVGAMRAHDEALVAVIEQISPTSGHLIKADGADLLTRRAHLPPGFAPYTFDGDPPPPGPRDLTAPQRRALEILLWQGYHLLTSLALITSQATPRASVLDRSARTLHALIEGDAGLFSVSIGDAPEGVVLDQAHLIGPAGAGTACFGQPYGPAARTTITTPADTRDYSNPFLSMWTAVAARLTDRSLGPDSAGLAINVERLAASLARLTQETAERQQRRASQ